MSITPITALFTGQPELADWLDSLSQTWTVTHVANTTDGFWDAIESKSMPFTGVTLIHDSAGTGTDLGATLASLTTSGTVVAISDFEVGAMDASAAARTHAPGGVVHAMGLEDPDVVVAQLGAIFGPGHLFEHAYPPPMKVRPLPTVPQIVPPAAISALAPELVAQPPVGAGFDSGEGKPEGALPGQVTIACMSSKGGSGKSTVALALAGTIAKETSHRVVVVDLDTRDGQVGLLIGQYKPTALNLRVQPVWDKETVLGTLVHDDALNIDALLAPMRPRNADDVGPDFYRQIIDVLQTTHDVIIFDCSVSYLDPLLNVAFEKADEILFVTSLANTSVQGMARALQEMFTPKEKGGLGIPEHKVGVVANAVTNDAGLGKDQLLRAASGAPLVGAIPMDSTAVLQATNTTRMGDLLKHPHIGPAFIKLAEKCIPGLGGQQVTQVVSAENVNVGKKGMFRR